jgi:hypothetical protein
MKHTVEHSFRAIFPFVATTAFMYGIGAICAASWNLIDWTSDLRAVVSVWAIVFGFMLWIRVEGTRAE